MSYVSPAGTVYVEPLKLGQMPRDGVSVGEALAVVLLAAAVPDSEALDETAGETVEEKVFIPELLEDEDSTPLDDVAEVREIEDTIVFSVLEALLELEAPVDVVVEPFIAVLIDVTELPELEAPVDAAVELLVAALIEVTELPELEAPVDAAVELLVAVPIDTTFFRVKEIRILEPEEIELSQVLD